MKRYVNTIFALEKHSADLCSWISGRISSPGGLGRGSRIRTFALVNDGEQLRIESGVERFDDRKQNASGVEPEPSQDSQLVGHDLRLDLEAVKRQVSSLQSDVDRIIRDGQYVRSLGDADHGDGFDISSEQAFYLLASAADVFAGSCMLQLAELIRWLFNKRYPGDAHSLCAVILLPELLLEVDDQDYANAYSLLKRIDSATDLASRSKLPPFDYCWLMDSRNHQGVLLDPLAKDPATYGDALLGLVALRPEMNNAPVAGTLRVRNKAPTYSAFGYSELFFPADIAVARLSAALVRDISERSFLLRHSASEVSFAETLIASKQFILRDDFEKALKRIEFLNGRMIWRKFNPKIRWRRGKEEEYIRNLNAEGRRFMSSDLLEMKQSMLTSAGKAAASLFEILDDEIDARCNANAAGLFEAREFVETLIDAGIEVEMDAVGERPKNLITKQREVFEALDAPLGIEIDRTKGEKLLDRLQSLYFHRRQLRELANVLPEIVYLEGDSGRGEEVSGVRSRPSEAMADDDICDDICRGDIDRIDGDLKDLSDSDMSFGTDSGYESLGSVREKYEEDIAELNLEIESVIRDFRQTVDEEDKQAIVRREKGKRLAHKERRKSIEESEGRLLVNGKELSRVSAMLEDARLRLNRFLMRSLVFAPVLAVAVAMVVLVLLAVVDIQPFGYLIERLRESLSDVFYWLAVGVGIYLSIVLARLVIQYLPPVSRAQDLLGDLERRCEADANDLVKHHGRHLYMLYQIALHEMQVGVIRDVINRARVAKQGLAKAVVDIRKTKEVFAKNHLAAAPEVSMIRRSVVGPEDIDLYYKKIEHRLDSMAEEFCAKRVSRAKVRRMNVDEFIAEIEGFARERFERLLLLSIGDVLFREADFLDEGRADQHLRALCGACSPLLQLREVDPARNQFAQYDVTLWAGGLEEEEIYVRFQKYFPRVTIRSGHDVRRFRMLSRRLHFPAYFISQIAFYRSVYEQCGCAPAGDLPDLIPEDLMSGGEMRNVYWQLLLGIALEVVVYSPDRGYYLSVANLFLGASRNEVAFSLATDFEYQDAYSELTEAVSLQIESCENLYERVNAMSNSLENLSALEREVLTSLAKRYHPLG